MTCRSGVVSVAIVVRTARTTASVLTPEPISLRARTERSGRVLYPPLAATSRNRGVIGLKDTTCCWRGDFSACPCGKVGVLVGWNQLCGWTKRVGFVATFRLAGSGKSVLKTVVSSWGHEYPHMPGGPTDGGARRAGLATAEITARGPLHPLRGAAPEQKGCNAYGSGAAHPITRTNAESARRPPTHTRRVNGLIRARAAPPRHAIPGLRAT